MKPLPLATQSAPERFGGERLLNMFARPWPQATAKGFMHHVQCSGMKQLGDDGIGGVVRAMQRVGRHVYAIGGGNLVRFDGTGVVETLGVVGDAETVTMCSDGRYVLAVVGEKGWTYDVKANKLAAPPIAALSRLRSCAWIRQRFIVSGESDGENGRFDAMASSDVATVNDWPGFAIAESDPDETQRVLTTAGALWVFGDSTSEVWYPSGSSFGFTPSTTPAIPHGVVNPMAATQYNGAVFWLSPGGRVFTDSRSASIATVVSSPHAERAIAAMSRPVLFSYFEKGDQFIAVRDGRKAAWCLNVRTGLWHERGNGKGPWKATCAAFLDGVQYLGGDDGRLYTLDAETHTDAGEELRREIVTQPTLNNLNRFKVNEFRILAQTGEHKLDRTPKMVFETSDDGMLWANGRELNLPPTGRYDNAPKMKGLGEFFPLSVFRLTVTDPVPFDVYGALIE